VIEPFFAVLLVIGSARRVRLVLAEAGDGSPHHNSPDNLVEVYVAYLRRKIDVPFGTDTIETIRGVGYRLRP
jgi:DNA-binding response OmpR family regulator